MGDATPSKRILVVEDDAIVRMLMVDILEELDFTVDEADGWDEAMVILQDPTKRLDMMVTDVGLTDAANRDGLQLTQAALKLRPDLPVLVASGYAEVLKIPEGVGLIGKPFSIDALRDKVNAMISANVQG